MTATAATARADRLEEVLAGVDLDALLVTDLVNVRWLTGFTGSNGFALVGGGRRWFVSDFRYVEQAAEQVRGFEFRRGPREILDLLPELLGDGGLRLGFDDENLPVRRHAHLRELLGDAVELEPAGGLVERLRRVKDAGEQRRIADAAALADEALSAVLERGLAGRTERAVAWDLEVQVRERGAEALSFPPIVAAGAHGALPHAEPRDVEIPRDALVVIDWGARLDGYCSDCTRTYATGEGLEDEAREVYELVRTAQEAALDAVAAGREARAVDGAARERIDAAGHGERFGHPLGHGVGLDVHEAPRVGAQNEEPLQAGEVVTVEPGVYLPGRFGVRIEDLVVVEERAPRVLTSLPKALTVAA